jgi:hypothetical protein
MAVVDNSKCHVMPDGGSRQKGWPIFGQDENVMRRAASSIARIPENFDKDLSASSFSSSERSTIRASCLIIDWPKPDRFTRFQT